MKKLALFLSLLVSTLAHADLTCNYPSASIPPESHAANITASPVSASAGFSSQFGAIGVRLNICNGGSCRSVLEGRNGAGGGWQHAFIGYGAIGNAMANQAVGNSIGYQWGYRQDLVSVPGMLYSSAYIPAYADMVNGVGVSPCANTGGSYDEQKTAILGSFMPTPFGNVAVVGQNVTLRATVTQVWTDYLPTHALYLSRAVMRASASRMYLIRNDNSVHEITPYDDAYIPPADALAVQGDLGTTYAIYPGGIKYIAIAWTMPNGTLAGVAVPFGYGGYYRLEKVVHCTNPLDDSCGAVVLIAGQGTSGPKTFTAGSTRSYTTSYYFGDYNQLSWLVTQ